MAAGLISLPSAYCTGQLVLYSFRVFTYALMHSLNWYMHAYTKCTRKYFSNGSFACTHKAKCEGNYVCIACVGITTTCDFPSSLNQPAWYMVINHTSTPVRGRIKVENWVYMIVIPWAIGVSLIYGMEYGLEWNGGMERHN